MHHRAQQTVPHKIAAVSVPVQKPEQVVLEEDGGKETVRWNDPKDVHKEQSKAAVLCGEGRSGPVGDVILVVHVGHDCSHDGGSYT